MVEIVNGVKNWASILDENTRLQAEMLSRSSVICGHVALMPDAHLGMGATVGSVIPTKEAVIPAAVGVDIGCGMIAVNTSLFRSALPEDLSKLHSNISRAVPAGFGGLGQWDHRNKKTEEIAKAYTIFTDAHPESQRFTHLAHRYGTISKRALLQLGTLGSGNHFVELGLSGSGEVWAVVHSGSRGVGNKLAGHHIKIAQEECAAADVELEDKDLAYLLEGEDSFDDYIYDMRWAQDYAMINREIMMDNVLDQIHRTVRGDRPLEKTRINCHHNFTQHEEWGGQEVWLTRKGAIQAALGQPGIVPGSMATGIFITEGLGNLDSYHSSAHGAGRIRSRGAAKRELSIDGGEGLYSLMEGITWNIENATGLLDEHPLAYKDLEIVMKDQQDLCKPITFITPILNYKGS